MFGTKHSKHLNRFQKTIKYQKMNRVQNTRIEIWKTKLLEYAIYNQVKLLFEVFAFCTKLALNYIKQARYN